MRSRTSLLTSTAAAVVMVAAASLAPMAGGVVTSKLQVHIPKSLVRPDGYDHRDALFGIPPYGGSIQQQVYYADSTLCDPEVDTTKGYPAQKDKSGKQEPWKSPFILMVDRGDCTFVKKVRNAQRAGAAAVLIADNTCLCYDAVCIAQTDLPSCEEQEPIMADDGSGADISIPSFLMFKQDADPMKEVLMNNQHVAVEMSFSVPAPDARVEYDLWTTPKDPISRRFLSTFKAGAVALGDKAFFTPHMYVYDGVRAGCQDLNGENQCGSLCTSKGRYCATDPDDDLESGISGADVVAESLRRICVWKHYGAEDGIGKEWWDYVEEFMYRCDNPSSPGFFTNQKCIEDALTHSKIDVSLVNKCVADSGGLKGNTTNTEIEKELEAKEKAGVVLIPSFFVNQAPVRGAMNFQTVLKAICAGYAQGSEPVVCQTCANCQDEGECVKDGYCAAGYGGAGGLQGGVSIPIFAATLATLTVCFGVIGLIQYRRQQLHMRAQVRGILAEYMPLDGNQAKPQDTSLALQETEGEFS